MLPPHLTPILAEWGVRYDGVQLSFTDPLLQFTDTHPDSPAHGATFYLPVTDANELTLVATLQSKRRQFFTMKPNPSPNL